jgi:uncharacterized membrane protein YgdD (TMEM256/DUF423 family)
MYKPALATGAFLGALAVILGAMGAHAISSMVTPDVMQIYQKAVDYHFYHVFAILAAGIIHSAYPHRAVRSAYACFLTGILLFSGSLYLLTFLKANGGGLGVFNLVTPLGGLFFIAGWMLLLAGVIKKK